jgi:hypothetical protein
MLQFEAIPPCHEEHTQILSLTRSMPVSDLGMVFKTAIPVRGDWK